MDSAALVEIISLNSWIFDNLDLGRLSRLLVVFDSSACQLLLRASRMRGTYVSPILRVNAPRSTLVR